MADRVLVTGASGMLGSQLLLDAPTGIEAVGTDLADTDLAEPEQIERLFTERGPFSGVIHAAGFTDVDGAETEEERAWRGNATATRLVAGACASTPLVVVGTDLVFDGRADRPYREEDPTGPLCAYGRTKLEAERAAREVAPAARIVRTQWLYGPRGRHFPGRILELARERNELKVVNDQTGAPTSTLELSPALWEVLERGEPGVYHAACEGSCTWFELAGAVLEAAGVGGMRLVPCSTAGFPLPAARPAYSVLDSSRLAALRGRRLAHWRDALVRYLASA